MRRFVLSDLFTVGCILWICVARKDQCVKSKKPGTSLLRVFCMDTFDVLFTQRIDGESKGGIQRTGEGG